MKYKLIIPFHWYSGESHTPPPYLKRYFDTLEEARKWKRRAEKKRKLYEKVTGEEGRIYTESEDRFARLFEDYFGLRVDGFVDGPAEIYEVSEKKIS